MTTAVLGGEALRGTEPRTKSGYYDFDAKYTDGMTDHICPANIPDDITEACKAIVLRAHQLLGCTGTSRSDFRWDDERGVAGLFLLEVNNQPGMKTRRPGPENAANPGTDYPDQDETLAEWAKRAQTH